MGQHGNTVTVSSTRAAEWMRRWDAQQERYIADREERFTVLSDIVESALVEVAEPVIVDLGCGPGSLAARLAARLPTARIIGLDSDPLLLGLARAHYLGTAEWVDADLGDPSSWLEQVPPVIHAAVSTTALHWLPPARLAALYRELGARMAPGGVFVNGDHLGFDDPALDGLARTVRDRRAARAGVLDNEDWGGWWEAILADPELAELARARGERRAAKVDDSHDENHLSAAGHAELLRAAGFSSVAPMWQVGDDHVLVGLR